MTKKQVLKYGVTVLIAAICIAAVVGVKYVVAKRKAAVLNSSSSIRRIGLETAPVKIVEFIDYRCGPCARGSKWLEDFMKRHPQDIFLEVEYFPLHKFPLGPVSFQFAECASRQGKFWEMHRLIFERQYQWIPMLDPNALFRLIAQEIGLDLVALDVCLKDEETKKQIERSKFKGDVLGVKATPTYVINGEMVVGTAELEKKTRQILGDR